MCGMVLGHDLAQLSRWLESHGLGERDLREERVAGGCPASRGF